MASNSANIKNTNITDKLSSSYLEYAMSVIIGRALPDVRDGLKPVHRRILFSMNNLNLTNDKAPAKSARVVGDVVGKYHPHGDASIYDALVRLAQLFAMRYPLVEGQGNFGSIDGDEAAAMRYTEARLAKITKLLLDDIDKNTVDFQPNYDDSLSEPIVLPTKLPTLLMNGSSGIAVGMATNIPPHNLGELIEAVFYLINNRKTYQFEELLNIVKGPDFPTQGLILGDSGIRQAYKTGRGLIKIRGLAHIEKVEKRQAIVITQLPYNVNKAKLVEKVAQLANDKKLAVHDIRDESDRSGIRVVVELKKDAEPKAVLNNLYKQTQLQTTFGINMLAVINKQPRVLNLSAILLHFIDHRFEVVTRRTRFDLRLAKDRLEIVTGLLKALLNIDEVVALIRSSKDAKTAAVSLVGKFALTALQAKSILEMRLSRLTGLEKEKLQAEKTQLTTNIDYFQSVLKDPSKVDAIIKEELSQIKKSFVSKRLTQLVEDDSDIGDMDLISPTNNVVTLSKQGYVKRTLVSNYQKQNRGGKGKIGMGINDEDVVDQILVGSTHDKVLLFSSLGKVFSKKIYELPEFSRVAKGRALVNFVQMEEGEKIVLLIKLKDDKDYQKKASLVMATKKGVVKRTLLSDFSTDRKPGTRSIVLDEGDSIVNVCLTENTENEQKVFIATRYGMLSVFKVSDLRVQGRITRGCRGIKLKTFDGKKDFVVSMQLVSDNYDVLTVSDKGYGKRTKLANYRLTKRGSVGTINMRTTSKTGQVASVLRCLNDDELMIVSNKGSIIRLSAKQISILGRVTQGIKLINLNTNDKVASVCLVSQLKLDTI